MSLFFLFVFWFLSFYCYYTVSFFAVSSGLHSMFCFVCCFDKCRVLHLHYGQLQTCHFRIYHYEPNLKININSIFFISISITITIILITAFISVVIITDFILSFLLLLFQQLYFIFRSKWNVLLFIIFKKCDLEHLSFLRDCRYCLLVANSIAVRIMFLNINHIYSVKLST